jgi:hypothetical protein
VYPPGTRWPSYTPRHWVPFSSPPSTRRATVEVFDPASTRRSPSIPGIYFGTDRIENRLQQFFHCCVRICYHGSVFAEPFPNKGCLLWLWNSGFVRTCRNTVLKIIVFNYMHALFSYEKHFLVDEFPSSCSSSVQEADEGWHTLT